MFRASAIAAIIRLTARSALVRCILAPQDTLPSVLPRSLYQAGSDAKKFPVPAGSVGRSPAGFDWCPPQGCLGRRYGQRNRSVRAAWSTSRRCSWPLLRATTFSFAIAKSDGGTALSARIQGGLV